MKHDFTSSIKLGAQLPSFTQNQIKNEPMLFSASIPFARENGGPITRAFLASLSEDFNRPDAIIDSRVHMLMPEFYPCIPGWHHDDVPRTQRCEGQPDYQNMEYYSRHACAIVGGCSYTEFALGKVTLPEPPTGFKVYKFWNSMVGHYIQKGNLESWKIPDSQIVYFDWQTFHRGTPSVAQGFRWFACISINTKRTHSNEIRQNSQVYLKDLNEGW